MVNRPKAIGTLAETAIVKLALLSGFPTAERRALAGSADKGDIHMCSGFIVEVKSGRAAEVASDAQIGKWLAETERERINAMAAHCMLITKRKGFGAERCGNWSAWVWLDQWLADDRIEVEEFPTPHIPVRLTVNAAFGLARWAGYGDCLPDRVLP